jgi:hypothetical protein
MNYEIAADKKFPQSWRVEAIDFDGDGDCFVTVFDGTDAEKRAREYAAWKESGAAQEVSPPSPLTCESNSITYRAPEVVSDEPEPEKCPTCNGYHLGGCHRKAEGDTRELKAALEDCIKIAARFVNSCDTQNIAATIYAHIKGRARSVGVF